VLTEIIRETDTDTGSFSSYGCVDYLNDHKIVDASNHIIAIAREVALSRRYVINPNNKMGPTSSFARARARANNALPGTPEANDSHPRSSRRPRWPTKHTIALVTANEGVPRGRSGEEHTTTDSGSDWSELGMRSDSNATPPPQSGGLIWGTRAGGEWHVTCVDVLVGHERCGRCEIGRACCYVCADGGAKFRSQCARDTIARNGHFPIEFASIDR